MADVTVEGRLLEWGNSFGIRIRKADMERAGLKPGEDVVVRIQGKADKIDVSHVRTFHGGLRDLAMRKREVLGEAAWARHERKRGRSS